MEDRLGKCHICEGIKTVGYCKFCEHWFCEVCRTNWFWRWKEAKEQFFHGRRENCCGPIGGRDA